MATNHTAILGALFALTCQLHGQRLDDAEVRITYGELKQLIARGDSAEDAKTDPQPPPALLAARLRLSMDGDKPVIDATFRTIGFGEKTGLVPLIAGDVSLESQVPDDAVVIVENESFCLVNNQNATRTLQLRLLPVSGGKHLSLTIPPCPSVIFETGALPDGRSLVMDDGSGEVTLAANQVRPLSNKGTSLKIRLLDSRETRELLSPPEPSTWTWQNQALVVPTGGDLLYRIIAQASAAGGSGVEAHLPLPADARDVVISGDDLVSQVKTRGENRKLGVSLGWKTRGILDRQLLVSYRMPLRPLDPEWKLQAPGLEDSRTRFFIATTPLLEYSAEGLSGTLSPQGIPVPFAENLAGATYRQLEGGISAGLTVKHVPVAATEEGVVKQAEWTMKIEPDGSLLASGQMIIEHKGPFEFVIDTPQDMKLLSCELEGHPVSPIDLGNGGLKISLPAQSGSSRIACSFTRSGTPLDPVQGTLKLSLPLTPLFIHSLLWHLELPAGHQAETHGNLTRINSTHGATSRISLRKNLCRNERPEVHVFYQRSDLNP